MTCRPPLAYECSQSVQVSGAGQVRAAELNRTYAPGVPVIPPSPPVVHTNVLNADASALPFDTDTNNPPPGVPVCWGSSLGPPTDGCYFIMLDPPGETYLSEQDPGPSGPMALYYITPIPLTAGVTYTLSMSISPINASYFLIRGDTSDGVYVDLVLGTIPLKSPAVTNESITGPDGFGYYTIAFDFVAGGGNVVPIKIYVEKDYIGPTLQIAQWSNGSFMGIAPFDIKDVTLIEV